MAALTLADLVRNGTMSPSIAATLATAGEERRSILLIAIPRMAGKTTTMHATLAHAPSGTMFHQLSEAAGPGLGIPEAGDGGYLLMSEIAQASFAEYLWGEPVRRAFAALERGFSLATALHAGGVDEAFDVICRSNGVSDADAARIDLAVYLRSIGPWREPSARRVATVHEIVGVTGGRPLTRTLHRWDEAADRFDDIEAPERVGSADGDLVALRAAFEAAARGGRG